MLLLRNTRNTLLWKMFPFTSLYAFFRSKWNHSLIQETRLQDDVFLLSPYNHPTRCYAWTGELSLNVASALNAVIKSGDTFIDIGAFVGQHSIRIAKKVLPHGKVILFEPDPQNWKLVQMNASLSNVDIIMRREAVSTYTGITKFVFRRASMSGIPDEEDLPSHAKDRIDEIACVSIDDIFEIYQPDVIKIDIEGFDGHILRRLLENRHSKLRAIVVESTELVLSLARKQQGFHVLNLKELSDYSGYYNNSEDLLFLRENLDLDSFKSKFVTEYYRLLTKPKVRYLKHDHEYSE